MTQLCSLGGEETAGESGNAFLIAADATLARCTEIHPRPRTTVQKTRPAETVQRLPFTGRRRTTKASGEGSGVTAMDQATVSSCRIARHGGRSRCNWPAIIISSRIWGVVVVLAPGPSMSTIADRVVARPAIRSANSTAGPLGPASSFGFTPKSSLPDADRLVLGDRIGGEASGGRRSGQAVQLGDSAGASNSLGPRASRAHVLGFLGVRVPRVVEGQVTARGSPGGRSKTSGPRGESTSSPSPAPSCISFRNPSRSVSSGQRQSGHSAPLSFALEPCGPIPFTRS